MSVNSRGRRIRFDNIAVGSSGVAGNERTIAGDSVSSLEMYGGGRCTSTSTGDQWHTNVKVGSSVTDQVSFDTPQENLVVKNSTDQHIENITKVGG